MNIRTIFKKEKSFKIKSGSRPVSAWISIVSAALLVLFASIAFHAFFLFGAENIATDASSSGVLASPQTIDRASLQTILTEYETRLKGLSSEKAAALASPDPSK